jgi:transmembrane sensor
MNKDLNSSSQTEEEFRGLDTDQKILWRSAQYKVPYALTKEKALEQLKAKIVAHDIVNESQKTPKYRKLYWINIAAAFILLLVGSWFLWLTIPKTEVIAEKGTHLDYTLPDGSEVTLNADSKLTFSKNNFNKRRNLELKGEAFFHVQKGKTFTVNTNWCEVKVLGTSFNVHARENLCKIRCLSGKVMVTAGTQGLIILPGESAIVSNNIVTKNQDKNIGTVSNWRIGEFYYENTSLNKIFKEIERQYNITFALPEINDLFFTGSFSNKNLIDALDIVCIPMGLTYEIGSHGKIFVRKKLH